MPAVLAPYHKLFRVYLVPQWPRLLLLAILLTVNLGLQLGLPRVVQTFIDQAIGGSDSHSHQYLATLAASDTDPDPVDPAAHGLDAQPGRGGQTEHLSCDITSRRGRNGGLLRWGAATTGGRVRPQPGSSATLMGTERATDGCVMAA